MKRLEVEDGSFRGKGWCGRGVSVHKIIIGSFNVQRVTKPPSVPGLITRD